MSVEIIHSNAAVFTDPLVSVIVPTIAGREHWLKRCLLSYQMHCPESYEIIVVSNRPACGDAWNVGLEAARGHYVHFTADDIEAHQGWWEAAVEVVKSRKLPAPRILNEDGTLQADGDVDYERPDGIAVSMTRIPFLSREQVSLIRPIPAVHYSTDVWVSEVARLHGIQTVMCHAYLFTHHYAPEGRVEHRLDPDREYVRERYAAYREEHGLPFPTALWDECAPQ